MKKYQEIYIKEHGYEKACAIFKHDCERCVKEYKEAQGKVAIACPTYPLYSDSVTKVLSYEDLFKVNLGEKLEREEKARAVQLEKEYEERKASKEKAEKNKIQVSKEKEERGKNENIEAIERNGAVTAIVAENKEYDKVPETVGTSDNNLGREFGESALEETQSEIEERKIAEKIMTEIYTGQRTRKVALFGESFSGIRKYKESWEKYINGD